MDVEVLICRSDTLHHKYKSDRYPTMRRIVDRNALLEASGNYLEGYGTCVMYYRFS